jgi:DNA-binding response OmpR family regulator
MHHAANTENAGTIFLAEDDDELRFELAATLRGAGYAVLTVPNGRDMLRLLTAASRGEAPLPDAMVMDVRMPRCTGLDVLEALRFAGWSQPVVMITGFGDAGVHAMAADRGAAAILDKPFDRGDLVAVLRVLLRAARAPLPLTEDEPTSPDLPPIRS